MKLLPYIVIAVLIGIILLQRSCQPTPEPKIIRDTVVINKIVRITEPGKTVYINSKPDTVWLKDTTNVPKPDYDGLLGQYTILGNNHFKTNIFKTEFKIADYGSVTVTDSIKANQLINSIIETNLNIPTTTITVIKEAPPKNQLYIGGEIEGNARLLIQGIYGGFLFKNKKDQIYTIGGGYNGEPVIKGGIYWKIKIR